MARTRVEAPAAYVNAYVDDRAGKLVLLSRDGEGALRVTTRPAEYVVYHRASDVTPAARRALEREPGLAALRVEGAWCRATWRTYNDRRMALQDDGVVTRLGLEHFEGDVHPVRRFLVDSGARIQVPRRAYLDIETESRMSFARLRAGEGRVLCWSIVADDASVRSGMLEEDRDDAERVLLQAMLDALEDFDQVLAWNGDRFDFCVLKGDREAKTDGRIKRLRIPFNPRRWLWLDQMVLHKRMNMQVAGSGDEKTSFALQAVSMQLLGEGKQPFDASQTWEAWEAGGESRAALLRYNQQDTDLLRRIEAKTGYLKLLDTICDAVGTFPDMRGMLPSNQLDPFMLRIGLRRGHHFKTNEYTSDREDSVPFRGAYVKTPPKDAGIMRNVHVYDFKSLYPSIIMTWNMSPETKTNVRGAEGPIAPGHSRAPVTGVEFSTAERGFLPEAVGELLRLRAEWNDLKASCAPGTPEWHDADRRTNAYKVCANSFYGLIGNETARYFDRDVAESISTTGAYLSHQTEDYLAAREPPIKVIYGDTDSGFATGVTREVFRDVVRDELNGKLYPAVTRELGCLPQWFMLKLEYEKEFARLVMTGKKRYCNPPEAPVWMGDLTFRRIGDVRVGDEVIGWDESINQRGEFGTTAIGPRTKRVLRKTHVVAVHRHTAAIVKLTMASGRTIRCTADHRWLHAHRSPKCNSQFITPKVGRTLAHVIDVPKKLPRRLVRDAAWLGGIFDGEGSMAGATRANIVISQSRRANPEVCDRIVSVLRRLGFSYHEHDQKAGASQIFALHGYAQERLNFLRWCRPVKATRVESSIIKSRFAKGDRIVSIAADGYGEVIGLTTKTGNYIAWGYASKNCGKYAHYKGKAAKETSEPEIKGLEFKRGDTAKLARRLQERIIRMLLGDWAPPFAAPVDDVDAYRKVISTARDYVLNAKLAPEYVSIAKTLSQAVDAYAVRTLKGGALMAQPIHVQVAHVLAARGSEVGAGTKVAYVVTDGSEALKAIPACDYVPGVTAIDRHYLWENLVWPPVERVLVAALPGIAWDRMFARTRPMKDRTPLRGGAGPGQGAIDFTLPTAGRPAVQGSTRGARPYVVRMTTQEADVSDRIRALKQALLTSPGSRPVHIVLSTVDAAREVTSEVTIETGVAVAGTPQLAALVARIVEGA